MTPICRLCQSTDKQKVRAPHVFGGREEHNFWHCEKCDAIYLFPVLTEEEEKKFYLQEFEKFMSQRVGDHRDWSNAELHKKTNADQVTRRLPFLETYLKPGIDLLEIGCSSGFMLDAFRKLEVNCTGVEPSGEFSEFLERAGYEVVEDLSELDGRKFDLISSFFVFEHIRDPFAFLSQAYGMLRENGTLIFEIPCANDPLTAIYDIDAFEKFYWSIAHHYYYTPESLRYILDKLGYKYKLIPEQRYDLSNHMVWMKDGRPGGQGKYSALLGSEVINAYRNSLINSWQCDTVFLYIWR